MPGSQMRPLVAEDGRDLGIVERRQGSFADHHAAAYSRQTVGKRLRDVQDAKVAGAGGGLGQRGIVSDVDQVDHHAVVRPPSPIGDGHSQDRDHQTRTDQHGQREYRHVDRPQRPAEPAFRADDTGGGPSIGTGHQHPGGDRDARAECG